MENTEDDVTGDMTISETSSMSSGPHTTEVPVPVFERRHRRGLHRTSRMAMGRMGRRLGGTEDDEDSWETADSPQGEIEGGLLQSSERQVNWREPSLCSPSLTSSSGVTSSSSPSMASLGKGSTSSSTPSSRSSNREHATSPGSWRSTSWVGRSSPSSPWRKSSEVENYDIEVAREDPWVQHDPWKPTEVMYENWSIS